MDERTSRKLLIELLKLAYSGERAAAYAYQGHWNSVRNEEDRNRIKTIEEEEWHHRKQVGEMLRELGERPSSFKEIKAIMIGRTAAFFCHITGWLAPMYGAGKLESRNVREYESAARYARDCGRHEFVDCLLTMAEVEWDHEQYFRLQVLKHPLGRYLPMWQPPPPKDNIRASFSEVSVQA